MGLLVGTKRALLAGFPGPRYYVDATLGNNGNDGKTPDNAWQTIAKVNGETFRPGESVLFKRGETWNEQLTPPSSGIAGANIIFDAYGSGTRPIIDGDDAVAEGINIISKDYLIVQNIIIRKPTNRCIHLDGATHITIYNCSIEDWILHGIEAEGDCHYLVVFNCVIYTTQVGADFVGIWLTGNNCHIHHNTIRDIPRSGIGVEDADGFDISYNLIYDTGADGPPYNWAGINLGPGAVNGLVYNNVLHDTAHAGIIFNDQGNEIYHNTIYSCIEPDAVGGSCITAANWGGSTAENNIIKNNVLVATGVAEKTVYAVEIEGRNNTWDYNIHYHTVQGPGYDIINWFGVWPTFAEWQTNWSQDLNGELDNPDFVNPGADNFYLQLGSPCIGVGATGLGIDTDYDGVTRGSPPDIGAYEYVA